MLRGQLAWGNPAGKQEGNLCLSVVEGEEQHQVFSSFFHTCALEGTYFTFMLKYTCMYTLVHARTYTNTHTQRSWKSTSSRKSLILIWVFLFFFSHFSAFFCFFLFSILCCVIIILIYSHTLPTYNSFEDLWGHSFQGLDFLISITSVRFATWKHVKINGFAWFQLDKFTSKMILFWIEFSALGFKSAFSTQWT